jgi:hypothetical protein
LYNQQATVPPSLIVQEGYSPEMESS